MRGLGWGAAVLALVLVAGSGVASAESDDPQAPVQIMLQSFELAPAGGGEPVTFTPFVAVFDQETLWDVCYAEPKIRDAFNMELMTNRLRVDAGGQPVLEPLVPRLQRLANRALGRNLIETLHLAPGQYDKDWAPDVAPPVPNPRDCKRIEFRTKRIK